MIKKCSENCRYAVIQSYGYSMYSVEGEQAYCAKLAHPTKTEGFDRFYGDAQQDTFAESCPTYELGSPVTLSVGEDEGEYIEDPDEKEIFRLYVTNHRKSTT